MTTPDMRPVAHALARRGLAVLPLHTPSRDGVCSCSNWRTCGDNAGKHPRNLHGVHEASRAPAAIDRWWGMWPDANVGIATGAPSGVVAVDVDGPDGEASLRELGGHPPAPVSLTKKGRHILFTDPGLPLRNLVRFAPGLDVRVTGGFIVAPPSLHASGVRYAWDSGNGLTLDVVAPPPMPQAIADAILRAGRRAAVVTLEPDEVIGAGQRNSTLARIAGAMRRVGASRAAIEAALRAENEHRCDPPLDDAEVVKIANSISRYAPAAPRRTDWQAALERVAGGTAA